MHSGPVRASSASRAWSPHLGVALLMAAICQAQVTQTPDSTPPQSNAPQSSGPATSEPPTPTPRLPLDEFRPRPTLVVPRHLLAEAKFPVVDVHTHFALKIRNGEQDVADFVSLMDRNHIAICVDLDGKLAESGDEERKKLWTRYRDRFVIFNHIDWVGRGDKGSPVTWECHSPEFAHKVVEGLRRAKADGIAGVKVFKDFGLELRNPDGSHLQVDDPRWAPIWEACGQLGLPVLIHTADPIAFFQPLDPTNERYEELIRHPEWHFPPERYPTYETLIAARNRLVARHPGTIFIAAHVASQAEDLGSVARWLDTYPNLYVDIASRIAELGRQPYTARAFLTQYADRVLFGTDGPWPEERVRLYWRFLETKDEYFPYSEKAFPPQGFWNIHGVGLDDSTLRAMYYGNAARLIPGVEERLRKLHPDLRLPIDKGA